MYISLEDIGDHQNEIDEMDIIWHLEKLGYRLSMNDSPNEKTEHSDKPLTFDMAIAGI